jgi:hypothetical protein
MLVLDARFHHLDALEVWWPASAQAVAPLLSAAPVVTLMQCNAQIADALASLAFRRRPFCTALIDLSLPEATLWKRLDQKSCRTEINRARRLGCTVSLNEHSFESLRLINGFIQRSEYRRALTPEAWSQHLVHSDVFVVHHQGQPVATHVVRVDGDLRARVLMGATVERGVTLPGSVIGALNRYLLWHEIGHYQSRGVRHFDFGGVTLDRQSPLYSIARFKLSFGGDVVEEHVVRLARDLGLRLALRTVARTKALVTRWRVRHEQGGQHAD